MPRVRGSEDHCYLTHMHSAPQLNPRHSYTITVPRRPHQQRSRNGRITRMECSRTSLCEQPATAAWTPWLMGATEDATTSGEARSRYASRTLSVCSRGPATCFRTSFYTPPQTYIRCTRLRKRALIWEKRRSGNREDRPLRPKRGPLGTVTMATARGRISSTVGVTTVHALIILIHSCHRYTHTSLIILIPSWP